MPDGRGHPAASPVPNAPRPPEDAPRPHALPDAVRRRIAAIDREMVVLQQRLTDNYWQPPIRIETQRELAALGQELERLRASAAPSVPGPPPTATSTPAAPAASQSAPEQREGLSASDVVEPLLDQLGSDLLDSDDAITNEVAMTNATGWYTDEYELLSAEFEGPDEIVFSASFHASGDQDEDKPFSGSEVRFHVHGRVRRVDGDEWEVVESSVGEVSTNF